MLKKKEIPITAIWLRRIDNKAQVLFERNGIWYIGIQEIYDGNFSHILEGNGMDNINYCPIDELVHPKEIIESNTIDSNGIRSRIKI